MKGHYHWNYLFGLAIVLITFCCSCGKPANIQTPSAGQEMTIKLPEPRYQSGVSIEQSLLQRRSIRSYSNEPLTLHEVAQLLWAAQGITGSGYFRTAPSAGALYPLEVYVVCGNVQGLTSGIYRYKPDEHELVRIVDGDGRAALAEAALGQSWIKDGAIVFVFTAVYKRTTGKYGERGIRYVHIEAGHAAQNLCLQATALDLGAVTVGAFYDEEVAKLLNLPDGEQPLYIIPVGRKKD